ncbi:MAG TPA: hypothetical protein VGM23_16555 [Armatimonadota bacterium]|jgi:hypothetical protein
MMKRAWWLVVLICLAGAGAAWAAEASFELGNPPETKGFAVWAVSPHAGLLFTDSEPLNVRVKITGVAATATVEYAVKDVDGPWHGEGRVMLAAGTAECPLPLKLPGRGLYQLDLTAHAGEATARAQTWIAIVFTPEKPDPASPWGIFYLPNAWGDPGNQRSPQLAAQSHRLLGASWSRLNFWTHSIGAITFPDDHTVTIDDAYWKRLAAALHAEGISIMGEIAQCPRTLSSRPGDTTVSGDAGALWSRVKPRDYALWDRFVAKLAADFREEIGVWEIWNEPNIPNLYWSGTVDEYAELVRHTARALKQGNPNARVAAGGFVSSLPFVETLFQQGIGKDIDILSVHYTDETPGAAQAWQRLLDKYGLTLPIWNTEEKSEIPLRNLASPVQRSFKFLHVALDGYGDYRPLVRQDWTVLPAGIAFSVGAHCLGSAKFQGVDTTVPGWTVYTFMRGAEAVTVFKPGADTAPRLFAGASPSVTLAIEPLATDVPVITDTWGRSRPLVIKDGKAELALEGQLLFLNGARKVVVLAAAPAQTKKEIIVAEAENGRWSPGWANAAHAGFSGGRLLEIWADTEPGADGYWTELLFTVPETGRYEVLFAGNALSRLAAPRSLSPFAWRFDGTREQLADRALPTWQAGQQTSGAPEGLSVLGTVELTKGPHTFRLRLTDRRSQPDQHYALWFDAIALSKVKE